MKKKAILLSVLFFLGIESGKKFLVGENIELKISKSYLTSQEINLKFTGVGPTKSRELEDHYLLSIRALNPGDHKIDIEDKIIWISVLSNFHNMDDKEIEEYIEKNGDDLPIDSKERYILIGLLALLTLLMIFIIYFKKRDARLLASEGPLQNFKSVIEELEKETNIKIRVFGLGRALRGYLKQKANIEMENFTSQELSQKIGEIYEIDPPYTVLERINVVKYTNEKLEEVEWINLKESIHHLINKIEEHRKNDI